MASVGDILWIIRNSSRRSRRVLRSGVVLLFCLAFNHVETVWASTFTVNRVQVFLSASVKSDTLTVRNVSADGLRFQLSVFAWNQSPQGEMILAPTKDIVFFPTLFSLAAGEERNIRVGTATPPGTSEKTYRLFIEELPAPSTAPPGQVTIRTRLGIPIFLRPPREITAGRVDALALRHGRLTFEVRNTGNVHLVAQAIRVAALGANGETVVETSMEGWYILAGGSRIYDLELPPEKCPAVKTVDIEVQTPQATLNARLEVTSNGCSR